MYPGNMEVVSLAQRKFGEKKVWACKIGWAIPERDVNVSKCV